MASGHHDQRGHCVAHFIVETVELGQDSRSTLSLVLKILGSIALLISAWVLVAELPRAYNRGQELVEGLQVTVYYSFCCAGAVVSGSLWRSLVFNTSRPKAASADLFLAVHYQPVAAGVFRVLFSVVLQDPATTC